MITKSKKKILFVRAFYKGQLDGFPLVSSVNAYLDPKDLTIIKQDYRELTNFSKKKEKKKISMDLNPQSGNLNAVRIIKNDKIQNRLRDRL